MGKKIAYIPSNLRTANWSEAEMMNNMEESCISVVDVGYKFVREFRSVPFSGEVVEIFDNRRRKYKFLMGRIKHTPLTSFSHTQNIEIFPMQMTMTSMESVEAAEDSKLVAAVMMIVHQTKLLTTTMKDMPLIVTGLRFGQLQ